ncbi:MAG: SurA N-terminal domain-containing protein [Bacillota bacterium]
MKPTERKTFNTQRTSGARKWLKISFLLAVTLFAALTLSSCAGDEATAVNDEIAATVNGEKISREEFEQALEEEKNQYLAQGIDLDSPESEDMAGELEEQVLYSYFVYPMLLEQKALDEGLTVSEEKIDDRYQEYAAAFGGEEKLLEEVEASGMDRDSVYDDITRELMIENYLDRYLETYLEDNPSEQITEDDVSVSEEEVRDYYEQLQAEYQELQKLLETDDTQMPKEQVEAYYNQIEEEYGELLEENDFEIVKNSLEEILLSQRMEQLKGEQEQTIIMDHIQKLEDESTIELNI